MLEGYVTQSKKTVEKNGKEYEVVTYQGEHSEEYVIRAVESGECRLFRKGVLAMSWREEKGQKVGGFTVYEDGKVLRKENWKSVVNHEEQRSVENCKGDVIMTIQRGEKNHVVYRGEFDKDSLKREGEGFEYDEESGRVLVHGVWKNDELFQILQEFESEGKMIEYEVIGGEENVSVLNRRPVYRGGYMYDKTKEKYVRYGKGNEIDLNTGIALKECQWLNGEASSTTDLFGGWYVKGGEEDSLRFVNTRVIRVVVNSKEDLISLCTGIKRIIVSSNCCHEESVNKLDLREFKYLERLVIGDECFENVDEVKLIGLTELESVVIGSNSFTKHKKSFGENRGSRFFVKDCPSLRELKIGCYSFSDYSSCEIENVNALEVIEIGRVLDNSFNFYHSSLELKSILIHSE